MKGRFADFARVRLKANIPRGAAPWPLLGEQLRIICNVNEDYSYLPPLYSCEWDVAGQKLTRRFPEGQLEPWPE